MTPVEIVTLILSIFSLLGVFYLALFRMAKIEARMDIVWGFILRQGVASSIIGGFVERNSPLRLSVGALRRNKELLEKIRSWYGDGTHDKLSDLELFMELEKTFNTEFTAVCLKDRVLPGGCTAAALFMLRPEAYKEFEDKEGEGQEMGGEA